MKIIHLCLFICVMFCIKAQASVISVSTDFKLNGSAAVLNPNSAGVLRLTNDLNQSSSAFLFNNPRSA